MHLLGLSDVSAVGQGEQRIVADLTNRSQQEHGQGLEEEGKGKGKAKGGKGRGDTEG